MLKNVTRVYFQNLVQVVKGPPPPLSPSPPPPLGEGVTRVGSCTLHRRSKQFP